MGINIVLLVLASAFLHPFWNLLVKKNPDPQLGYVFVTIALSACGLVHGLIAGVDFSAVSAVWPFVALSVCGQLLYGTGLTATLKRGELSTYYPIIRASPVFVVAASVLLLGKSYPPAILLGIAMAVAGGFALLYRRGSRMFEDPRALAFALLALSGSGIYSMSDARMMQAIEPQVMVFTVESLLIPIYGIAWLRRNAASQTPLPRMSARGLAALLLPGVIAYASYYLILTAYQLGGEVAAVTSVRQASIPISVALGGLFLREGAMLRRFAAAGVLMAGIIVIALFG
jgi:drug/metabolite transporter (DMT)-like permease